MSLHMDTVMYCWQHYIMFSYASVLLMEDWKGIFTSIYGLRYFPFRVSDDVIGFLEWVWNSPVFMHDNKREKAEMILLGMVFVSVAVLVLSFYIPAVADAGADSKDNTSTMAKERQHIYRFLTFTNLVMARHERMYGAPSHKKVD